MNFERLIRAVTDSDDRFKKDPESMDEKELKKLADDTAMFDSITDEAIAANKGRTYQDVTALRDPLLGLGYGEELTHADTGTSAE